ncbi:MAG TPA: choice-of-anchor Q domain-containing protein, partial [Polyangiaceae bacterium]|nr:choice-of-anchor Q domain-containing protein [Polyangiaceae bacterium]
EIPTGTYELTACGADDRNAAGDLDLRVNRPVELVATGPDVVIRQTCAGERVLEQHGRGLLTLTGVTITGGSVTSADPAEPALGGGVRAQSDVVLTEATIRENSATAAAGSGEASGGAAYGGGLYVRGSLTAKNARVLANTVTGGAAVAAASPEGIGIGGGAAEGGGVYVLGAMSFSGGAVTQNRALGGKGGDGTTPGDGGSARGAGLAQASTSTAAVQIERASLTSNHVEGGAAGYTPMESPSDFAGKGVGGAALGGALAASGALHAIEITASQNTARGGASGAGPERLSAFPSGLARGGALHGTLTVTLDGGEVSDNRAESGDTIFTCYYYFGCGGGSAGAAAGGGVWGGGNIQVSAGRYSGNSAATGDGLDSESTAARGGAIASSASLTVTGGEYTGNRTDQSYGGSAAGGALSALTLSASGARFTSNESGSQGGAIAASSAQLSDIIATQNKAYGVGGGAVAVSGDATVTRSKFTENVVPVTDPRATVSGGGALSVLGQLTISDSEVTDNHGSVGVQYVAGTNFIVTVPGPFQGGGIRAGTLQATNVTLANNSASGLTTTSPSAVRRRHAIPAGTSGGGGIAGTAVSLTNTTVTGNRASMPTPFGFDPTRGSAVLATSLELDHATIADNLTSASLDVSALLSRRSTVIAPTGTQACGGTATTTGSQYNWFSDASCALPAETNQQRADDFFLGPLADNGGPIRTRAPGAMSVLVESIPASACTLGTDARGVTRPQGSTCDIGAVEVAIAPGTGRADLALSFSKEPETVGPGSDGTWELTLHNRGPNASTPAVRVDVPAGVLATSFTATGASCTTSDGSAVCVWNSALPSGTSATLTFVGRVEAALGET